MVVALDLAVDRAAIDAQRVGDRLGALAIFDLLDGALAQRLLVTTSELARVLGAIRFHRQPRHSMRLYL